MIIQLAPGGPVEQILFKMKNSNTDNLDRISIGKEVADTTSSTYRASEGVPEEVIEEIKKSFGFDKPLHERFFSMIKNYLIFDFGNSFYQDKKVMDLIQEKMPVSISLGIWTTLIAYLISIPLGIRKALRNGSRFDSVSTIMLVLMNSIPSFLFGIALIILFCGGDFWNIFPISGLISDNFSELSIFGKICDYFWHLTLPILAMSIGGFASLTFLCKNSFMNEIGKQYVFMAKAKGLSKKRVIYGHIFRNAMLIVISGFPAAFIGVFFTSSMLIEVIFSLDGLGLLSFNSTIDRDYPVIFASLYIFSLIGIILAIITDLLYSVIDPRIRFD